MWPRVPVPTGTVMGAPVSTHRGAAHQAVGGLHGDGAHAAVAQVLGDLGVDVDDRADDAHDAPVA
jgi:hypothetical protein